MKIRLTVAVLAIALLSAVVAPSVNAGGGLGKSPARQVVRMEGWVVDSICGRKNANPEGAACVLECLEKGAEMVFIDLKGNRFELSNQEKGLDVIGQQVKLFGTLDKERVLTIGKFILPNGGSKKADDLTAQGSLKPSVKSERGDGGGDQ
jgi:hypothetical protein